MKLPDFTNDSQLNSLRSAMGALLAEYVGAPRGDVLTAEEIESLVTEGIEIPIEDVKVLNDGTHVYKGRRVIVYIRDVAVYGGHATLPRFHPAMCDVLAKMIEENRYLKRYVVAAREDGRFKIHRIRGYEIAKSDEMLDVCQCCLDELSYKGFSLSQSRRQRQQAVSEFSIHAFFDEVGRNCVWAMPRYDEGSAPANVYSVNFYRVARSIKEQRGYRCEETNCRIDLSRPQHRKYLHAHHVNADKTDNHPLNIKLLCIRCHANTFQHSHLRRSPDYEEFCRLFPVR